MKTVLIVDASRMQRLTAESILERNGFMPMSVNDARQGLHLARMLQPDLVLVDTTLPGGLEALHCMITDPRTRGIPAIATGTDPLGRRALLHGARDYLPKPVSETALQRALARLTDTAARSSAASPPAMSIG